VHEQELYSGQRLKRGVRNLHRLDYFEEVKVNTEKGSADDKMILKIDVKEKPTGTFSFGGGFSSVEQFFAMASINQRNLFGRGQNLGLEAHVGGTSQRYKLSFTEPWLFDIPLSAGFDIYNWNVDYSNYDKKSFGGGVRFGYPVYDFTRAYLSYGYEVSDITNIDDDASDDIKDLAGTNITSAITTSLRYDSRDRLFNPTEGQNHSLVAEFAGGPLGGDIGFAKFTAETGFYVPLFWGTVGFFHAKTGYITDIPGDKLPDYERFYLGGINSLRGFDWREVNVLDDNGDEIGGDKMVQFNLEYIFPLIKEAGLAGVVFFDTGNVYGTNENIDLGDMRETAGFGFRWFSPLGPIRLEWGHILDPEKGRGSGSQWEFSMGTAF
jgi:outer membrane protein insertion porin family